MEKFDTKKLFSGKAKVYAGNRPSYPEALKEWLLPRADFRKVADVGAGTGIFTAFLQDLCQEIIGVEPNEDMRQIFLQTIPERSCLAAPAEEIPLPDGSLTLITAAQAFHWFQEEKFKWECRRLLRDGGKLLIVWNNAVDSPFTREVREVCRKYCPAFRSGHAGARTVEEGDRFLREEYFADLTFFQTSHDLFRTEEQFLGDQLSRSYALREEDPGFKEYVESLQTVFRKYAGNGTLRDEYLTTAYLGTV